MHLVIFLLLVSVICIFVMKKIQPESFKLYLVYVVIIDVLFCLISYIHICL